MIGFSTGVLWWADNLTLQQKVDKLMLDDVNLIEVMFHKTNVGNETYYKQLAELDLSNYKYRSLHMPYIRYGEDPRTEEVLSLIEEFARKNDVNNLILHPNTVVDWNVLLPLKDKILIESMNSETPIGQDVKSLTEIFALFDARMLMDIQHAYSTDPTMKLAEDLINAFKDKICAVHLSGFKPPFFHIPLYSSGQGVIGEALKKLPDVTVILEGAVSEMSDDEEMDRVLRAEIQYVRALRE